MYLNMNQSDDHHNNIYVFIKCVLQLGRSKYLHIFLIREPSKPFLRSHVVMHLSVWIQLGPHLGWPKEFWWRKGHQLSSTFTLRLPSKRIYSVIWNVRMILERVAVVSPLYGQMDTCHKPVDLGLPRIHLDRYIIVYIYIYVYDIFCVRGKSLFTSTRAVTNVEDGHTFLPHFDGRSS